MSAASNSSEVHCCGSCAEPASDGRPGLSRQVAWLQGITLVWMTLECGGSLLAAARAHSVALLAFGSDSLIELLSAMVVLLQFAPRFPLKKEQAERAAAVLLFALAVVVVLIAALAYRGPVETSWLGMTITALALVAMPVLAGLKRRQARKLNNRALAADATQSATCAYLAAVTLAGLAANAVWHVSWVDSAAALLAVPILMVEGADVARRRVRVLLVGGFQCGVAEVRCSSRTPQKQILRSAYPTVRGPKRAPLRMANY